MSDMKHNYEIYLIEAPGYWYVGSTTIGAAKRFAQHRGFKSNTSLLSKKMREMGSAVFCQVVVERAYGDPIEAEALWYDFYKAHDSRQTLNGRRPGSWDGTAKRGHVVSEATRLKISNSLAGRTGCRKGAIHTPEALAKMSAAQRAERFNCGTCEMVTNAGCLQKHQNSTGHEGRIPCAA